MNKYIKRIRYLLLSITFLSIPGFSATLSGNTFVFTDNVLTVNGIVQPYDNSTTLTSPGNMSIVLNNATVPAEILSVVVPNGSSLVFSGVTGATLNVNSGNDPAVLNGISAGAVQATGIGHGFIVRSNGVDRGITGNNTGVDSISVTEGNYYGTGGQYGIYSANNMYVRDVQEFHGTATQGIANSAGIYALRGRIEFNNTYAANSYDMNMVGTATGDNSVGVYTAQNTGGGLTNILLINSNNKNVNVYGTATGTGAVGLKSAKSLWASGGNIHFIGRATGDNSFGGYAGGDVSSNNSQEILVAGVNSSVDCQATGTGSIGLKVATRITVNNNDGYVYASGEAAGIQSGFVTSFNNGPINASGARSTITGIATNGDYGIQSFVNFVLANGANSQIIGVGNVAGIRSADYVYAQGSNSLIQGTISGTVTPAFGAAIVSDNNNIHASGSSTIKEIFNAPILAINNNTAVLPPFNNVTDYSKYTYLDAGGATAATGATTTGILASKLLASETVTATRSGGTDKVILDGVNEKHVIVFQADSVVSSNLDVQIDPAYINGSVVTTVDGISSGALPQLIKQNQSITLKATANPGYYISWSQDVVADGNPTPVVPAGATTNPLTFTMPANQVTMVAQFLPFSNSLTVRTNDSTDTNGLATVSDGTNSAITSGGIAVIGATNFASTVNISADPTVPGYHFAGWTDVDDISGVLATAIENTPAITTNGGSGSLSFAMPNNPVSIKALFISDTYHLSAVSQSLAKGTATGDIAGVGAIDISDGGIVSVGDSVVLSATPAPGYNFSKWTAVVDTTSPALNIVRTNNPISFNMPNGDIHVVATFIPIKYNVTVSASPSIAGFVELTDTFDSPLVSPVDFGQDVKVTATPDVGYNFVDWTVISGGVTFTTPTLPSQIFTMPNSDVSVQANFAPIQSVLSAQTSTGDLTQGSVSLDSNTNVANYSLSTADFATNHIISATPKAGYDFVRWSVTDVSGKVINVAGSNFDVNLASAQTITMPENNVSFVASFIAQEHVITINYDSIMGSVVSQATASTDSNVSISATANPGYSFIGWTTSDVSFVDVSNADQTFIMPANDIVLTANFVVNNYNLKANIDDVTFGSVTATDVTTSISVASGVNIFAVNPSVAFGDTAEYQAIADVNYYFAGWTDIVDPSGTVQLAIATLSNTNPSSDLLSFTMPSNDVSVKAVFILKSFQLTASSIGAEYGTVTGSIDSGAATDISMGTAINVGQNVLLHATPLTGYDFAGWKVITDDSGALGALADAAGTSDFTFDMPLGNVAILGSFVPKAVDLTVDSAPVVGGTVTINNTDGSLVSVINNPDSSSTANLVFAQNVTVTATPSVGYNFVNWTSSTGYVFADDTQLTQLITMPDTSQGLTANFIPVQSTLSAQTSTNDLSHGSISLDTAINVASSSITADFSTAYSISATPKAGYSFDKWSVTDLSGKVISSGFDISSPLAQLVVMPENDVVFVANFIANVYTITVHFDGTMGTASYPVSAETDSVVNISATPLAGYAFDGWTTSDVNLTTPASSAQTFIMPANDVVLNANFVVVSYLATADVNDYTFGSVTLNNGLSTSGASVSENADFATNVTYLATPTSNYYFAGWKVVSDTSGTVVNAINALSDPFSNTLLAFGMPSNDVSLTALFVQITSPLSAVSQDDTQGIVTATTATITDQQIPDGTTAGAGDAITLKAIPEPGYEFIGWKVITDDSGSIASVITSQGATTTPIAFNMPTGNLAIMGLFAPIKVGLTVTPSLVEGGIVSLVNTSDSSAIATAETDPATGAINAVLDFSQSVTVTAIPNTGYNFVDWTVISGGITFTTPTLSSQDLNMPAQDVSVQANFAPINSNLSVTTLTGDVVMGSVSVIDPSNAFYTGDSYSAGADFNTQYQISATVHAGYIFVGWDVVDASGKVLNTFNLNNNSTQTITMPENLVSFVAKFIPITSNLFVKTGSNDLSKGSITVDTTSSVSSYTGLATAYATLFNISATPVAGYDFVNWTVVDNSGAIIASGFDINNAGSQTISMPFNNATFIANFTAITNPIILTYDAAMGAVSSSIANAKFVPMAKSIITLNAATDDYVTLTAVANTGYSFVDWTVNSGGVSFADPTSATQSFRMPASSVDLSLQFVPVITVKTNGVPNCVVYVDAVGGDTTDYTAPATSATYAISATPVAGFRFARWQVTDPSDTIVNAGFDVNLADLQTFTMPNTPVSFVAVFESLEVKPIPSTSWLGLMLLLVSVIASGFYVRRSSMNK